MLLVMAFLQNVLVFSIPRSYHAILIYLPYVSFRLTAPDRILRALHPRVKHPPPRNNRPLRQQLLPQFRIQLCLLRARVTVIVHLARTVWTVSVLSRTPPRCVPLARESVSSMPTAMASFPPALVTSSPAAQFAVLPRTPVMPRISARDPTRRALIQYGRRARCVPMPPLLARTKRNVTALASLARPTS